MRRSLPGFAGLLRNTRDEQTSYMDLVSWGIFRIGPILDIRALPPSYHRLYRSIKVDGEGLQVSHRTSSKENLRKSTPISLSAVRYLIYSDIKANQKHPSPKLYQ
jgi:hypothetical protein